MSLELNQEQLMTEPVAHSAPGLFWEDVMFLSEESPRIYPDLTLKASAYRTNGEFRAARRKTISHADTILQVSEHGASITSLNIQGIELVHYGRFSNALSEEGTWGQIHMCLPMVGKAQGRYERLPKHGLLGEGSLWHTDENLSTDKRLVFSLRGDETLAYRFGYPSQFIYLGIYDIEDDGSLTATMQVYNISRDKKLHIAPGWHPYLKNPSDSLDDISIGILHNDGGVEKVPQDEFGNLMTVENLQKTLIYEMNSKANIQFSKGEYAVTLTPLAGFDGSNAKWWLWTNDPRRICVEPTSASAPALGVVGKDIALLPAEAAQFSMNIARYPNPVNL